MSSRKLPQPAMWAFYRKVRQSVADNEPWDRFARDILTASGSTLTNGGGNYFVLHKDVSELAEATVGHVPGHLGRVREVPQPPAGEVDAGRILGLRQPLQPRRAQERRPRGRSAGPVAPRRRGAPPPPRRADAAQAARRQAARRSTPRSIAATTSPTGSPRRTTRTSRRRSSIASGGTSWAAGWSRPRTTCASRTRRATPNCSTPWPTTS